MRKLLLIAIATITTSTIWAQTPEAIREMIRENYNFAKPTVTTYQNIEIGEIARAPKGYKPFYYTVTSRHGSRYELKDTIFTHHANIYNRAAELGILTPLGEEIRQILNRATVVQMGKEGELAPLGQKQLRGIGERAYKNFKTIFNSGSIEGKSSTKMRCVFSMVAFVDGLKKKNGALPVELEARESYLKLLRPLDSMVMPKHLYYYFKHTADKGWRQQRREWYSKQDISAMLSKVVTKPELLVEKCGESSLFEFFCMTHHLLCFAINFEICDDSIIPRIFTLDELYTLYSSQTARWVNFTGGIGNPVVEARISFLRPLIDDILGKAQDAIDGKNPHVANLRFTHDSYMVPLLAILGYKDCALQYSEDLDKSVVSIPFSKVIPMAANVQIILYRNKKGEVLVRSLVNEKDAYLPIKCATAPFYPWKDFCDIANKNMTKYELTRDKFFKEHNLQY